jgi:hypothetical protein
MDLSLRGAMPANNSLSYDTANLKIKTNNSICVFGRYGLSRTRRKFPSMSCSMLDVLSVSGHHDSSCFKNK